MSMARADRHEDSVVIKMPSESKPANENARFMACTGHVCTSPPDTAPRTMGWGSYEDLDCFNVITTHVAAANEGLKDTSPRVAMDSVAMRVCRSSLARAPE
jgi:hypothetical protein